MLKQLSFNNRAVFSYLPDNIKQQLLLDRDPHGNVQVQHMIHDYVVFRVFNSVLICPFILFQVAKIETEKLLAQTVSAELDNLAAHGKYTGQFAPQFHSYGYEGRSCLPSTFDSTYCYALVRLLCVH